MRPDKRFGTDDIEVEAISVREPVLNGTLLLHFELQILITTRLFGVILPKYADFCLGRTPNHGTRIALFLVSDAPDHHCRSSGTGFNFGRSLLPSLSASVPERPSNTARLISI